jgi:hypothetical protein
MTTVIKTAATSKQVREPELTAEDLKQVVGGGGRSSESMPSISEITVVKRFDISSP